MVEQEIQKYYEFMVETAYQAGKLTLSYFYSGTSVEFKEDDTPVTVADRKAEAFIRRRIEKKFPTHAIIGEELGLKESRGTSHRWIIDPIDGTKTFIRGVPLYGVLLALEIEGEVVSGAAYFPALDEMIAGATGIGCFWNGRRTRVSQESRLDRAYVTSTTPGNFSLTGRGKEWMNLERNSYFQAGWGDAYGYALVATGRIEIMLDPIMNVWDAAPFLPILTEAGGYFGDWKGNPTIYANEGLGTNHLLLPQLMDLLISGDH